MRFPPDDAWHCRGSGPAWTVAYIDSRGDPTCDLRSNIAAESRAKVVYERLINVTDDPGIKEALGFLMTREIAHQKSFEKALYAIDDNFPSGKLPGIEKYANMYVNTSQGDGDEVGPWNSGDQWSRVDDLDDVMPADDGDGTANVTLGADDQAVSDKLAVRTASDATIDPETGVDLGAGPGAGLSSNTIGSVDTLQIAAMSREQALKLISGGERHAF